MDDEALLEGCECPTPAEAAAIAGLHHVDTNGPGLRRLARGTGFTYVDADGRRVGDGATLTRIRSLAIPPAWTDVWICSMPRGHIQATGRDGRGRKQYRYHPDWADSREEAKFDRLAEFAALLPRIRAEARADMARDGLCREKVVATVVWLLDTTLIRIGNDEYRRRNKSFGLTTLRDRHVGFDGSEVRFSFTGKSGKSWNLSLQDRRVARIVRSCQELPGQHLFQYLDGEGARRPVASQDVNAYIAGHLGAAWTARSFRTWAGTVLAATALAGAGPFSGRREAARMVNAALDQVASRLVNTRAIARRCYVHPAVIEAFLEGSLPRRLECSAVDGLTVEESRVLGFLKACGPDR
jgi:DNA topoisomerase-1